MQRKHTGRWFQSTQKKEVQRQRSAFVQQEAGRPKSMRSFGHCYARALPSLAAQLGLAKDERAYAEACQS